jgi:predicted ATPase/Tfp pilus assembly protein PilF
MRASFTDGRFFVDLTAISAPDDIFLVIAQALGVSEQGAEPLRERLRRRLGASQLLLILDNFEHLTAAARSVNDLLAACPQVKALVTSRVALRVRGEHIVSVAPLPLPDSTDPPPVEMLAQAPSVALFAARARQVQADFALTSENAATVVAICRQLDGLPLAIELAATRLKVLPPPMLLILLEHRLQVLTDGAQDLPMRQQTLRRTLAWSYDLLLEPEQALFRRLAIFVGGCTLEAAEVIRAALGGIDLDILDGMTALVDHSLVRMEARADGTARFTMLETLREYGQEQLALCGETEAIARAHATCCLEFVEALSERTPERDGSFGLALRDQDYANLRVALGWAIEQGETAIGARLIAQLWRYWYTHGMLTEGRKWAESLLAMVGDAEDTVARAIHLAAVLNGAGMLAFRQGDYTQANVWLERSLALYRRASDTRHIAAVLNNLGIVATDQGDYAEAQRLHAESLALKRTLGVPQDVAISLSNLGCVARAQRQYALARTYLEENLTIQRAHGDVYRIAHAIGNLGTLTYAQEAYEDAYNLYTECLDLQQAIGDTQGIALTHLNLSEVTAAQGDFAEALEHGHESLRMFRALGEPARIASALVSMGLLFCAQGEATRTVAYFREALDLFRDLGTHRTAPLLAVALARLAHHYGLRISAVRFLAVATSLRAVKNAAWIPAEQRQYELLLNNLREELGQDVFQEMWDKALVWLWDDLLTSAYQVLAQCGKSQAVQAQM